MVNERSRVRCRTRRWLKRACRGNSLVFRCCVRTNSFVTTDSMGPLEEAENRYIQAQLYLKILEENVKLVREREALKQEVS